MSGGLCLGDCAWVIVSGGLYLGDCVWEIVPGGILSYILGLFT